MITAHTRLDLSCASTLARRPCHTLRRRVALALARAAGGPIEGREGPSPPPSAPDLLHLVSTRVLGGLAAAAVLLQPAATLAAVPEFQGKQLFDAMAYSGRWYEVASLKKGFAGEGQGDCHCTQGIYVPQEDPSGEIKLQVNTFCIHGGPGGRLSGIQGSVSCADPVVLELLPEFKSDLEREFDIKEKCVLKFDSLPFIPAEPYNVIRTDYTTYALVQGSKDRSFVQIYSRTSNPGPDFIKKQKDVLAGLGYPVNEIKDTPQDCEEVPATSLMSVMNKGMAGANLMPAGTPPQLAMRGYDLGPAGSVMGIKFERVRNLAETVKDVFQLFKMSEEQS